MALDTGGNVRVDFVWGNLPMQPDDARGGDTLDPALDSHVIADTAYNGFPGYTPSAPYLDTIANVAVPNVVGSLAAAAQSAIEAAGLVYAAGTAVDNAGGATAGNDGKVATQSPAAAAVVNEGATVTVHLYDYTP